MTSMNSIKVLLLHARDENDPMIQHEYECFVACSKLDSEQFKQMNFATQSITMADVLAADAVMIGGSGAYSVVNSGFDWHQNMLDLLTEMVAKKHPLFASCFGFQALLQTLGAELVSEQKHSELGTFAISLTEEGKQDPIFGQMPVTFDAQLGHNDSAITLPDGLVHLAYSDRCHYQAVRVANAPIYATQFHPELTELDNITRYMRYLKNYLKPNETMEHARQHAQSLHRPSPSSNQLIHLFLEHIFGD